MASRSVASSLAVLWLDAALWPWVFLTRLAAGLADTLRGRG